MTPTARNDTASHQYINKMKYSDTSLQKSLLSQNLSFSRTAEQENALPMEFGPYVQVCITRQVAPSIFRPQLSRNNRLPSPD